MRAHLGFGTQPRYEAPDDVWVENRILKCSDKNQVAKAQSYLKLPKGPNGTKSAKKKKHQRKNTNLGKFLENMTTFQRGVLNGQVLLY